MTRCKTTLSLCMWVATLPRQPPTHTHAHIDIRCGCHKTRKPYCFWTTVVRFLCRIGLNPVARLLASRMNWLMNSMAANCTIFAALKLVFIRTLCPSVGSFTAICCCSYLLFVFMHNHTPHHPQTHTHTHTHKRPVLPVR